MLGTLLEKRLKNQKDDKILVVMDDGLAFLGNLEDFDKNTILLTEVYQGSATEIDWSKVTEVYPDKVTADIEKEDAEVGFIKWTHINMDEVYLRVGHISRIWMWTKEKKEKEEKSKEEKYVISKPIYTKTHDIPNIGSSYDLPGGIPRER